MFVMAVHSKLIVPKDTIDMKLAMHNKKSIIIQSQSEKELTF